VGWHKGKKNTYAHYIPQFGTTLLAGKAISKKGIGSKVAIRLNTREVKGSVVQVGIS
jgi:hypothetical protein